MSRIRKTSLRKRRTRKQESKIPTKVWLKGQPTVLEPTVEINQENGTILVRLSDGHCELGYIEMGPGAAFNLADSLHQKRRELNAQPDTRQMKLFVAGSYDDEYNKSLALARG